MIEATYVLPLKWDSNETTAEMTSYLRWLSARLDVIVVDGSAPEIFERHAEEWTPLVKHMPPDEDLSFINGKVNGVTTGVRAAGTNAVIIADDDIRFDEEALEATVGLLGTHEIVMLQSYFEPTPWQALWDQARVLLNRAFGANYPSAIGINRELFMKIDGYEGDVLFENLELIRSMRFAGARVAYPKDVFVRHLPPTTSTFWSQRVRHAYDDFTIPWRMALWLSLLPLSTRVKRSILGVLALTSVGIAEAGRQRGKGRSVFPARSSLFAPLWLVERAICSWAALHQRLFRGGAAYRGTRLKRAATPRRELRRKIERRLDRDDQEL